MNLNKKKRWETEIYTDISEDPLRVCREAHLVIAGGSSNGSYCNNKIITAPVVGQTNIGENVDHMLATTLLFFWPCLKVLEECI